jgi:zinc and cadmium transporter
MFHFHSHDAPDDVDLDHASEAHQHHNPSDCDHDRHHADPTAAHPFSWTGAAIGLTLHSLIDGVALAAAVWAEQDGQSLVWAAGLGTFLAVALHKPFDSLSIDTLMAAGGWSASARNWVNALYALTAPCGVLLFYLGAGDVHDPSNQAFIGRALALAGGAFLCIATSDLLPELQFHRHDPIVLSLALVAGVALAWSIVLVESTGHDHHTPGVHEHEEQSHGGSRAAEK